MIKFNGVSKYISEIPTRSQLERLTNKELIAISLRFNVGFKKILIDYLMSRKTLKRQ